MNIFENIVYYEDAFTTLLKNYMKYKKFRDVFLDLLALQEYKEEIDLVNFSTQKSTENNGRPDLVISNDSLEVFIEVKVKNSHLTENQPIGYLNELENSSKEKRKLVFLIPTNYKYLNVYEKRLNYNKSSIETQTIYWSEIVGKIEESDNMLINEFYQHLKNCFVPKEINIDKNFTNVMNNTATPTSIEKLVELIEQIRTQFQMNPKYPITFKNDFLDEFGFYYDTKKFSLFVGEWFEYWQKEASPLCIALQTKDQNIKDKFKMLCKEEFSEPKDFENRNWLTSPIDLNESNEDKNYVDNIFTKLEKIFKEIS